MNNTFINQSLFNEVLFSTPVLIKDNPPPKMADSYQHLTTIKNIFSLHREINKSYSNVA
jgi:hypothetical protein